MRFQMTKSWNNEPMLLFKSLHCRIIFMLSFHRGFARCVPHTQKRNHTLFFQAIHFSHYSLGMFHLAWIELGERSQLTWEHLIYCFCLKKIKITIFGIYVVFTGQRWSLCLIWTIVLSAKLRWGFLKDERHLERSEIIPTLWQNDFIWRFGLFEHDLTNGDLVRGTFLTVCKEEHRAKQSATFWQSAKKWSRDLMSVSHPGAVLSFSFFTTSPSIPSFCTFSFPSVSLADFGLESIPQPDPGWSIISSSGRPQWKPHQLSASIWRELPLPPHTRKQIGIPVDSSHFLCRKNFSNVSVFPHTFFLLAPWFNSKLNICMILPWAYRYKRLL